MVKVEPSWIAPRTLALVYWPSDRITGISTCACTCTRFLNLQPFQSPPSLSPPAALSLFLPPSHIAFFIFHSRRSYPDVTGSYASASQALGPASIRYTIGLAAFLVLHQTQPALHQPHPPPRTNPKSYVPLIVRPPNLMIRLLQAFYTIYHTSESIESASQVWWLRQRPEFPRMVVLRQTALLQA